MHPKLKDSVLRAFETKILYNYVKDEQYELDEEAFNFLSYCTGRNSVDDILKETRISKAKVKDLIKYLTKENCIEDRKDVEALKRFVIRKEFHPSLRYLQLHITEKCNLNCKHCYLGTKGEKDLKLRTVAKILQEFSEIGTKVIITGGEPLLHNNFWEVLKLAGESPLRVELLTNGMFITPDIAAGLARYADAIQISLDGMKNGHEALRGKDTFEAAVEGIKNAKMFMPVTCATMIYSKNLQEFDAMELLLKELNVDEWILDLPSDCGNMSKNKELAPDLKTAVSVFKKYGYSSGMHAGDGEYSCGSHMCSISADGEITKCGFFDKSAGNIEMKSLESSWKEIVKNYIPKLEKLNCAGCKVLQECRGGCRFRAEKFDTFYGKDPFMCVFYENDK